MSKIAKTPYNGYKLYKVWHKKEQRWFAVLVKTRYERTTVAYAKYLLEVRVGKRLGKEIHAHHKDGVKIRDVNDNIQKISRAQHNTLHHTKDYHWRLTGYCAYFKCRKEIDKPFRGCLPRKAKQYFYCNKVCLHKALKNLKLRQNSQGEIYYGPKVP